ncbi:MAG: hypothetical protein FJX78_06200 [Armatimonadetes bacterium]|nr:hypothetical protein [Armatimonadota bacterium]
MPVLVRDCDQNAAVEWVASRIPHVGVGKSFGPSLAVGVASGLSASARLYAVVIFHDWQPAALTAQASMAAASPLWATRGIIRALFAIPFFEWGANKVWVAIPHANERAIRFNKGIGMKQEAVLRHQFGHNSHAVICSMLRREFNHRYGDYGHGQKKSVAAARA